MSKYICIKDTTITLNNELVEIKKEEIYPFEYFICCPECFIAEKNENSSERILTDDSSTNLKTESKIDFKQGK